MSAPALRTQCMDCHGPSSEPISHGICELHLIARTPPSYFLAGDPAEWAAAFEASRWEIGPDHVRSLDPDDFEAVIVWEDWESIEWVRVGPAHMRSAVLAMYAREPGRPITIDVAEILLGGAIDFARGE